MIAFPNFADLYTENWGLIGFQEYTLFWLDEKSSLQQKQTAAFAITAAIASFVS